MMDGVATSDLLKSHCDLHPIIARYVLTSLDIAVDELAIKDYRGGLPAVFMWYWDKYKAEMIEIFEGSFPEIRMYRWIIYDDFRHDILVDMADALFGWLCDAQYRDEGQDEFLAVDFAETLGIILYARQMNPDMLFRATNMTSISMAVNTAMINDHFVKADS